jgi:ribosomal protein S27E
MEEVEERACAGCGAFVAVGDGGRAFVAVADRERGYELARVCAACLECASTVTLPTGDVCAKERTGS